MVITKEITFSTKGAGDIIDLSGEIAGLLGNCGVTSGIVTAFTPSATSGLTTLEFEPGLRKDVPELMEKLVPSGMAYKHDQTWHDGNGFSHLRAALIGPDITIPFTAGKLHLGTWQQVVFLEFDNRPRDRRVVVQIMGE